MHALVLAASLGAPLALELPSGPAATAPSTTSAAASTPASRSAALARGRAAEESLAFDAALTAYTEAERDAPEAAARAAWLRARGVGGFTPLAILESVRRTPGAGAADVERLARAADAFPAGLVRAEARALAGEAFVRRLGAPGRGRALLLAVADDSTADDVLRSHALDVAVRSAVDDGALEEARAALARAGDHAPPAVRALVAARSRRAVARGVGALALAAAALGSSVSMFAYGRRGGRFARATVAAGGALREIGPAAAASCGLVACAGAAAAVYAGDAHAAMPFVTLAAALAPVLVAARVWSAVGAGGAAPRLARAIVCACAALGAAVLVLENVEPSYLETFGL